MCIIYWKIVTLVGKELRVWEPFSYKNPKWIPSVKKRCVDAEFSNEQQQIHQIIQIFCGYWGQLKAREYYAWSCSNY